MSSTSYELYSVYDMAMFGPGTLPADLSSDNALLLLIALLADINTATTVFEPLVELVAADTNNQIISNYSNPLLPFSLQNEATQAKKKLHGALDAWHRAYVTIIKPEVLALYYFSRLQLVFPNLQYLPILAGYYPRVVRNTTPNSVLYKRIQRNLVGESEALKYAWLILESCNSGCEVTPVWFPITVFYASLVVWIMVILSGETRSHGSLKVLAVFKMEL
jgi:hypothetical protein